MPLALQTSLLVHPQDSYVSLAALIAAGYDYILLLPQEIDYIWTKPWTRVSTSFIFVRYCGLMNLACTYALLERNFIVGPVKILGDIQYWTYILFLGAADVMMILRVWAMYNRSRAILGIVLAFFFAEIISMAVALAIYIKSRSEQTDTMQGLGYSFCVGVVTTPMFQDVSNVLQISFAAVLCILAIVQFVKQSLQMFEATKQWQLNRYINLLLNQGILYFFVIFLLNLIDLLSNTGKIPGAGWKFVLTCLLADVPAYTLAPRFTISIREMYANDVQGRSGDEIDSGLDFSAITSNSGNPTRSIEFMSSFQGGVENVGSDYRQDGGIESVTGRNEGRDDIGCVLPGRELGCA